MSDVGALVDYNSSVITTASLNSLGIEVLNASSGRSPFANSAVWPGANLAVYVPFRIATPTTIVKMFWVNASAGTDSVDVGIYDSQGNQLVHSGSTLTSGTSSTQVVNTTDITLERGLYYAAMAYNGITNKPMGYFPSSVLCRGMGVYNQASAFPLPSTATFAGASNAAIPLIGMQLNVLS